MVDLSGAQVVNIKGFAFSSCLNCSTTTIIVHVYSMLFRDCVHLTTVCGIRTVQVDCMYTYMRCIQSKQEYIPAYRSLDVH